MATAAWIIERVNIGSFVTYSAPSVADPSAMKFGVVTAMHRTCWVVETLVPMNMGVDLERPLEVQLVPYLQLHVGNFERVYFELVTSALILVAPEAYFFDHSIVFRAGMEGIYILRCQVVKIRSQLIIQEVPLERFAAALSQQFTGPMQAMRRLQSVALEIAHFPLRCYLFRNELVSLIQAELRLSRGRRNSVYFRMTVGADMAGFFLDYLHLRGVPLEIENGQSITATVVGTNTIRRLYAPARLLCASFSDIGVLVGLLGELPYSCL